MLIDPAVREVETVRDLEMFREPALEEEPVPEIVSLPKAMMFPLEAMVKIAVFALLMNCSDSDAAGRLLVDLIVNLC